MAAFPTAPVWAARRRPHNLGCREPLARRAALAAPGCWVDVRLRLDDEQRSDDELEDEDDEDRSPRGGRRAAIAVDAWWHAVVARVANTTADDSRKWRWCRRFFIGWRSWWRWPWSWPWARWRRRPRQQQQQAKARRRSRRRVVAPIGGPWRRRGGDLLSEGTEDDASSEEAGGVGSGGDEEGGDYYSSLPLAARTRPKASGSSSGMASAKRTGTISKSPAERNYTLAADGDHGESSGSTAAPQRWCELTPCTGTARPSSSDGEGSSAAWRELRAGGGVRLAFTFVRTKNPIAQTPPHALLITPSALFPAPMLRRPPLYKADRVRPVHANDRWWNDRR